MFLFAAHFACVFQYIDYKTSCFRGGMSVTKKRSANILVHPIKLYIILLSSHPILFHPLAHLYED